MFQFPELATYDYVFIVRLGLFVLRVSPFGNLRLIAC